jgi:L-ascorbate metabolism protein UlaG (beta-lactamase superfamily)
MITGSYITVDKQGDYILKDIPIKGLSVFHDDHKGSLRGKNLIYTFKTDGLTIAHMGDLGHLLNDCTLKAVGSVDILLVPVGGKYTLDNKNAFELVKQINPKTAPTHNFFYIESNCLFCL